VVSSKHARGSGKIANERREKKSSWNFKILYFFWSLA